MNSPSVSILIPAYNAERWVGEAIESALSQTYPEKEVLVHDDGSTDGTQRIVRSFGGRVRWGAGPNRGANTARNALTRLASGDWLQYLDADDYLLPEHVARQVEAAQAAPQADVVFSPLTDEHWKDGQVVGREVQPVPEPREPNYLLARWGLPGTHGMLFRREAVLRVGGWKDDQPCCQEFELMMRLLKAGAKFVYSPFSGGVYRHWSASTISKRNVVQAVTARLAIEREFERHLVDSGALTPLVRAAFARGRLECARQLYAHGRPDLACEAAAEALHGSPGFSLPATPAFPFPYRLAYRLFGFRSAERIARLIRGLRVTLANAGPAC
jgi:glycosyltransferase involved in cell wall biosynthesis